MLFRQIFWKYHFYSQILSHLILTTTHEDGFSTAYESANTEASFQGLPQFGLILFILTFSITNNIHKLHSPPKLVPHVLHIFFIATPDIMPNPALIMFSIMKHLYLPFFTSKFTYLLKINEFHWEIFLGCCNLQLFLSSS